MVIALDVKRSLATLGYPEVEPEECTAITQGMSGAHVLGFSHRGRELVLKFTPPDAEPFQVARSAREYRFYTQVAPQVAVPLPELVAGFCEEQSGVALLLGACTPPVWTRERQHEAVRTLARLHRAYWGPADLDWMPAKGADVSADERESAAAAWAEALQGEALLDRVAALLARLDQVLAVKHRLPRTLCHGDFHMANLLVDDASRLVICDWQEVCAGAGPEDLAFFLQRAMVGGLEVDPEELISLYASELGLADRETVADLVAAATLQTTLLQWPFYFGYLSAEGKQRVFSLMESAAQRLGYAPLQTS